MKKILILFFISISSPAFASESITAIIDEYLPFFVILYCSFVLVKHYEKEKFIKKENNYKRIIENKIPRIVIPLYNDGEPKKPQLENFSLEYNTYAYADYYENLPIEKKMKINLPSCYYENKGIYFRYCAYNIAINLYNKEMEIYNIKQEKLLKQQKSYWQKHWAKICKNGFEFEKEIGNLFRQLGYKVKNTKGTGDGGVDLILKKDGQTTIVQCKAHKHPVGPEPVRALWGVKEDFNANDAIFIAYSGATHGAKNFAKGKKLKILDIEDIINLSLQLHKSDNKCINRTHR